MLSDKITIIILTYKSKHIIDECMRDILGYKNIVVVDNASGDNIGEYIKLNYPNVKFIGLEKNIGFGRANNVALGDVKTEYALVLNPDAKIMPESIDLIIKVMDGLPNAALGSPLILNNKKKKLKHKLLEKILPGVDFDSEKHQKESKIKSLERRASRLFPAKEEIADAVRTDFICGCGMFFKMSLMRKIGFFDENIFMYHEDSIISQNVIKSGYDNVIVNDGVLRHICNGSTKAENKTVNEKLTYFKNWQAGWSLAYMLSNNGVNDNKELSKMRRKLFWCKMKGEDTVELKAKIDGFMDYAKGADPFSKAI